MNQHNITQDIFLSTEELSKRTGLTVRFWEARRLRGDSPPFIRLGCRAVRYRWNDVQKWLEERLCTSTSDQGQAKEKETHV